MKLASKCFNITVLNIYKSFVVVMVQFEADRFNTGAKLSLE